VATASAPRRTVLDKLLVDGTVAAGAELREGCTVEQVLVEDGAVTGVRVRSGDTTAVSEPPPPELQALLGALPGNPEAAAGFVSVIAGTLPAPELFAPDNVQRIMAAAAPGEG